MSDVPLAPEGRQRVRMVVAYDGTRFHGMARNPGVRTVAGLLEARLSAVFREPITLTVAGRTDRGVHAWGQVVSFDAPGGVDPARLRRSLNGIDPALAVREVELVDDGFDARFAAEWRRYRYTVWNSEVPHPFLGPTSWHVRGPLDLAAMRAGSIPLVGMHDFTSFCRRPPEPRGAEQAVPMTRRVLDAEWTDRGGGVLQFEITATAFCHQMVRSIVGLLVDVGHGRRRASDVVAAIGARDRSAIANVAPPQGLCLWAVGYSPA